MILSAGQPKRLKACLFCFIVQGQYVEGNATTNTIEGFWGIFKRGVIGVYQKTSKKHLQKYVNEFVWRYNMRNSSQGFQYSSFLSATNHRTKYKELVA